MTTHCYTSFSFSYLSRARILAKSVKRFHPDWIFWAVITDRPPAALRFDPDQEPFDRILSVEDLYGETTEPWLFRMDVVEACTAVKGRAAQHIIDVGGAERLLYLDPDIAVLGSLHHVEDSLDRYDIILTPHQVSPEETTYSVMDNEVASLKYGVFNLGFFAVSDRAESRRFLNWWSDRLDAMCYDRTDIGIFVDQKWCNLVPAFFDSVLILRDPGYNVASWNLSNRTLSFDSAGNFLCNSVPLRFYHFTKFGPVGDAMTARYAKTNTEVYELWTWYRHQLEQESEDGIPERYWHYATFADGTLIEKPVRQLYRDREDLRRAFPTPFSSGSHSFHAWTLSNT